MIFGVRSKLLSSLSITLNIFVDSGDITCMDELTPLFQTLVLMYSHFRDFQCDNSLEKEEKIFTHLLPDAASVKKAHM